VNVGPFISSGCSRNEGFHSFWRGRVYYFTHREKNFMLVINGDNFESEVMRSEQPVVMDLWGPKCSPCLALMPYVEALAEEYAGRIKFAKLNVMENRRLAITLKVMGVPTFLFYMRGEQKERITGDHVTREAIRAAMERLLSQ
jgi:thioredoxin 1